MLVYKIEKKKYESVFPSRGSLYCDGRWSRKDMWVVYSSESIALAKLETLANTGSTLPKNRIVKIMEIEDNAPMVEITPEDLPSNWAETPYPKTLASIIRKIIGSGTYLGAIVPSSQSKRERNLLLFPDFHEFNKYVKELESGEETFDTRLKRQ